MSLRAQIKTKLRPDQNLCRAIEALGGEIRVNERQQKIYANLPNVRHLVIFENNGQIIYDSDDRKQIEEILPKLNQEYAFNVVQELAKQEGFTFAAERADDCIRCTLVKGGESLYG